MASSYTSGYGLELMPYGAWPNTWYAHANSVFDTCDRIVGTQYELGLTSSYTGTSSWDNFNKIFNLVTPDGTQYTDTNPDNLGRCKYLVVTDGSVPGNLGATNTLNIAGRNITTKVDRAYFIKNALTSYPLIVTNGGAGSVTIAVGETKAVTLSSTSSTPVGEHMDGISIPTVSLTTLSVATNFTMTGTYPGAGTGNIALGPSAFNATASGANNIAVGSSALVSASSGNHNICLGRSSLGAITTGNNNIAIGDSSATSLIDAVDAIAIGDGALFTHTGAANTANSVVAIGFNAMHYSTNAVNASGSVFIGDLAGLYHNGLENVAIGHRSLGGMTTLGTGDYNVAVGHNALGQADHTGSNGNVAVGHNSLTSLTTGISNTAVGRHSALALTTASNNTVLGAYAGLALTTSSRNTIVGSNAAARVTNELHASIAAFGYGAMYGSVTNTDNNTAVGNWAMSWESGTDNTAVGYQALNGANQTSTTDPATPGVGSRNTAVGSFAMGKGVHTSACVSNVAVGRNALMSVTSGQSNISIGDNSLPQLTTGVQNISLGQNNLASTTTGNSNIAIGKAAGNLLVSSDNITIGVSSLRNNVNVAGYNIAIGSSALNHTVSATGSIAVGHLALQGDAAGTSTGNDYNVAVGYSAMLGVAMTTANNNVAVGKSSLRDIVSGISNVAIGNNASMLLTTAAESTAVGHNALSSLVSNNGSTAVGAQALDTCTSGGVTAIGAWAGRFITTASGSTLVGNIAGCCGFGTPTLSNVTAIGYKAAGRDPSSTALNISDSVFVGSYAGTSITTGTSNVAIGHQAMFLGESATNNVGIGTNALSQNVSATGCVAVGYNTLLSSPGDYNTAVGESAMTTASLGADNVAVGRQALYSASGSSNVAIGNLSGSNSVSYTGSENVLIGYSVAPSAFSGNTNVIVGSNAGFGITNGSSNVYVGSSAGSSNTSGSYNVCIGRNADTVSSADSNKLSIHSGALPTLFPLLGGTFASSPAAGGNLRINGDTSASSDTLTVYANYPSFVNDVFVIDTSKAADATFNLIVGKANTANQFRVRGDGTTYGNGAWNSSGADYAEYFEWEDGNPDNEDRTGMPVFMVPYGDGKIAVAPNDMYVDIIGVVSRNPAVIGNSNIEGDKEYDPKWGIVGLIGRLPIRKGSPVDDRWIMIRELDEEMEEWLVR